MDDSVISRATTKELTTQRRALVAPDAQAIQVMQLLDLPTDLLVALPFYLDSVNDLYSLITTCRSLHITCHATKASLPLRPREQDGQYSVRPYPHLLIAGAARQVGDWAVQSIENRNAFHSALMRGIGGLLELSVNVGRMNLAEMQRLHRIK